MPKKASQKGTGKMGERRYRKSKGGYQQAHIGGPQAIRASNHLERDTTRRRIERIKRDGKRIFREYVGGSSPNWGLTPHGEYVDLNAELVEIWRVVEFGEDVDFVIVPSRTTLMRWEDLVRRLGFETKTFNPNDSIGDVMPPKWRHRKWDDLTAMERFEVWRWRWSQGILAK